jgi:hypothetical protein
MRITNKHGLPDAILKAVEIDEHRQADVSVTGLINPVQMSVLTKQHWDEIEADCADRIWLLLGKSVHYILEKACPSEVTELYLEHEIDGVKVSGSVDNYHRASRLVSDYKVTSVFAVKDNVVKPEWEAQLNLYAYLLAMSGEKVDRLQIVAILRDWSETQAMRSDYPQSAVVVLPVRLWSRAEQDQYIRERVALWVKGMAGDYPPCTDSERWAKQPTWACTKKGNKKATKLFDLEAPAVAWAATQKDMEVIYRPGEQTRCVRYCGARKFCKQGQSYAVGVCDE